MKILIFPFLLILNPLIFSQTDSSWQKRPELIFSGITEVFYVYDFNQPQESKRQSFLYNHNRHNEFNLNLGFIKIGVEHPKYRANSAVHTGTYANDNYAKEPDLLKNIFEANAGISLNKKNNLWLDAGVFASHIGFESAVSFDNRTMTRSLLAENSPYFLSGAKISYSPNDKWKLEGLILNGWQRIQRLQGNSMPSFGTRIYYTPTEKIMINWSTFIGTDDPDSTRRMRYFNNFYGQFQITENLSLIAGFDIGTQQSVKGSSVYDVWYSPILIAQYSISTKLKTALRAEYYRDKTGIIIPTGTPNGFNTTGLSINVDYTPHKDVICRMETRWLNSEDRIFESTGTSGHNNFIIGTSIAIRFQEVIK